MGVKKLSFFLVSTVVFGSLFGGLLSVFGVFVHISWFKGIVEGGILATNCLMGFWAYLMLKYTVSAVLPLRVWRWAQVLVLCLVVYDMVFWRSKIVSITNGTTHMTEGAYIIQGLWPLVIAVIGGFVKYRFTGKGNFVASVFFLYVFTVLDWVLVLKVHSSSIVNQTGLIMMACNFYILFLYPRLLSSLPYSAKKSTHQVKQWV